MSEVPIPSQPPSPSADQMLREAIKDPKELKRYEQYLEIIRAEGLSTSVMVVPLDAAINWARANSIWPLTFGLACCAIEMMAVGASKLSTWTASAPAPSAPRRARPT